MTKTLTRTITAALLIAALAVPAAAATTADIGVEKAKEAALSHAGVAESDTVFLIAEADYDDGRKEYEVEFYTASQEYDYEIHAETGGILSRDREAEWNGTAASGSSNTGSTGNTSSTTSASTTDIGEAKARSVALSHAGISESSTSYIYAKKDWDDGRWVYDVEFWADGKEYDYEILASNGTILSYDYDAEYQWSGSSSTSGDTISTEKVKSIVTDRAGVSGTFRELKLERDDGRTVYEGEMRSGRTDYEFTIDAYTGAVLEWDTDWDD